MISAVAQKYHIHPQTLRLYEREGLLKPSRTEGNTRLYSEEDLEQLETILTLTRDLGVNLAGVEVILNMRRKIQQMQGEVNEFMEYVKRELCARHRRLGAATQHGARQINVHRSRARESAGRRLYCSAKKTRALKRLRPFVRAIIVRASAGARQESLLHLQRYRLEGCPRTTALSASRAATAGATIISKRLIAEAPGSAPVSPLHA